MIQLKFTAVDSQDLLLAAVQGVGERFYRARLAGPGWPEQEEHADGPPFRGKTRAMHLYVRHDLFDGMSLTD